MFRAFKPIVNITPLPYCNYIARYSNRFKLVIALAIASFLPAIFLPHIGEEGVYTISSLEMLYNKEFWQVTLYGGGYPRPPLYNWSILAVGSLLQLQDLLLAARIVAISSTLGIMAIAYWLAYKLSQQRFLGILTCGIFLSGDLLLRRGWLAYSDPLFALFVFASMAFLWLAVHELAYSYLLISIFSIIAGFLTKVHTIYVFYGVMWITLFYCYSQRRNFLLSYKAILLYGIALGFPWFWGMVVPNSGEMASTIDSLWQLWQFEALSKYLVKLGLYPVELIIRTLPISGLLLLQIIWHKYKPQLPAVVRIAGIVIVVNILPYWLTPYGSIRYLMPLYPLVAMVFAYLVYQGGELLVKQTLYWLFIGVVINYLAIFFWYPYEQTVRKGNAKAIAQDIVNIVKEQPLYTNNSNAGGLRISAELNTLRRSKPPLQSIGSDYSGYVIVNEPSDVSGKVVASYKLGGITVYLKCNGEEYCH